MSRDSRKGRKTDSANLTERKKSRLGSVRKSSNDETLAVVPYLQQKPKNRIELKAFHDLEKIRKRREELKKRSSIEQERKQIIEEKKKEKLKSAIEQRRMELGIKKKKEDKDAPGKLITNLVYLL